MASFEDVGKSLEGLLSSLVDKDDEGFVKEFSLQITKYMALTKTGTAAQRAKAEEIVNDLLLTGQLKLAQKQIIARRGMKEVFPQVLDAIFSVVKAL